jgi:hypothetical protein
VNLYIRRLIWPSLIAAACTMPAVAQAPRASGQTYVYQLAVNNNISTDYSTLPASVRGQAQAMQAAGNKTPIIYVFTLTTDRVNSDGSAHVNVSFTNSLESNTRGADPSVLARFNQFEATFGADGRLIPQYDPNMHLTVGAHGMSPPEEIHNQKAQQMSNFFADFNTFAGGCAKRGEIKAGDAWRVVSKDQYANPRTYDFAATSVAGAVATVVMKGNFTSPNSTFNLDATGRYDLARRLVLDLRATNTFKNTTPTGMSSSGTTTMEYELQ